MRIVIVYLDGGLFVIEWCEVDDYVFMMGLMLFDYEGVFDVFFF